MFWPRHNRDSMQAVLSGLTAPVVARLPSAPPPPPARPAPSILKIAFMNPPETTLSWLGWISRLKFVDALNGYGLT